MMMSHYRITLKDAGIAYDCSHEQTLLAGMEKLGRQDIPVGCRGGGCGICKVRILDGHYTTKKMSRAHIGENEQGQGFVLACRCFPGSDLTLEVIGQMKNSIHQIQSV